jgi:RNA polymerase sigma-70 factor, ECF subfamily
MARKLGHPGVKSTSTRATTKEVRSQTPGVDGCVRLLAKVQKKERYRSLQVGPSVTSPPGNPGGTSSEFSCQRIRVNQCCIGSGEKVMLTFIETPLVVSRTGEAGLSQGTSDEALITAIAAGDRRAMHVLYVRHSVRVYRFVLRLTNDSSLAEDIVSEVFIDVWRGARGFKAKSQVSTWLLAIARNKALSAMRIRMDEQLHDEMTTAIADSADDAETTADKRDRSAIVQHCLSKLSPLHRQVIDLVYYHEKSVAEVAQIVEAPANTVKTRMFYARKRMENLLKAAGLDRN